MASIPRRLLPMAILFAACSEPSERAADPATEGSPSIDPDALAPCELSVQPATAVVGAFAAPSEGAVYLSTTSHLFLAGPEGERTQLTSVPPVRDGTPQRLFETADGSLWAYDDVLYRRPPDATAWEAWPELPGWCVGVHVDAAGGVHAALDMMGQVALVSFDAASASWTETVPWRSGTTPGFLPDGRMLVRSGSPPVLVDGSGEAALWAGSSTDDGVRELWVGGDGTIVVEQTGDHFEVGDATGPLGGFTVDGVDEVWVGGPDDVWVASMNGPTLHHYDGIDVVAVDWPSDGLAGGDPITSFRGAADGAGGLTVVADTREGERVVVEASRDGATLAARAVPIDLVTGLLQDDATGAFWASGARGVATWDGAAWVGSVWDHRNGPRPPDAMTVSDGQLLLVRSGSAVVEGDDATLSRIDDEVTALTAWQGTSFLYVEGPSGQPPRVRLHQGGTFTLGDLSGLPADTTVAFAAAEGDDRRWLGLRYPDGHLGLALDDGAGGRVVLEHLGLSATAVAPLDDGQLWFLGAGQLGVTDAAAPAALSFMAAPEGIRTLWATPDGRLLAQTVTAFDEGAQASTVALHIGDGAGRWTPVWEGAMSAVLLPAGQRGDAFVTPLLHGETATVRCP